MRFIDKLERRFGVFAVTNLTLYLVIGQAALYVFLQVGDYSLMKYVSLIPALVMRGEVWRLFTFVFEPPASSPIFIFFALYFFYIMGSALELYWGSFKYNLFLFIGWAATVGASFLTPLGPASVTFIGGSVFLAFAAMNPNFQVLLFFFLPVKIKWLAWLTWAGYLWAAVSGSWSTRFMILASLLNYLLFFRHDIIDRFRTGQRALSRATRSVEAKAESRHECVVCGATELSAPDKEFRYCAQCEPVSCYCLEHLAGHAHRANADHGAGPAAAPEGR